ncbi:MAG: serine hydrolase [Gemmatimonadetes bacterium]|nr:serine hydrolase [Gemmatimonadota bacterium]
MRIPGESHGARDRPSHHIAKVAYITDWFTRHRDTPCCALPAAENTAALTAFADSAARGDFGYVDAVHVVRNGVPLISRTFPRSYEGVYAMKKPPGVFNYQDPNWHPFYQGRTLHTLQSVSKSIVSLVYGVAIARKDIATIDQPIAQFIPAHAAAFRDSVRRKITIRHLLTMTSGISWPEVATAVMTTSRSAWRTAVTGCHWSSPSRWRPSQARSTTTTMVRRRCWPRCSAVPRVWTCRCTPSGISLHHSASRAFTGSDHRAA